jgi:hypothetical protein
MYNDYTTIKMSFLASLKRDELTPQLLQSIVASGVNISATDDQGDNALQILIDRGASIELITMLLDNGFATVSEDGEYALTSLCREDNPNYDLIILLIERGCPVTDAFPEFVEKVPQDNVSAKALQIVQMMLDEGVDLEKTYDEGETIFMLTHNAEVLRLLINEMKKRGLQLLKQKNDNGDTVMTLAKENYNDEIIELLEEELETSSEEESSSEDEEEEESDDSNDSNDSNDGSNASNDEVTWDENSTLAELKEILEEKYGFTDFAKLPFKGTRKQPLIDKLKELAGNE